MLVDVVPFATFAHCAYAAQGLFAADIIIAVAWAAAAASDAVEFVDPALEVDVAVEPTLIHDMK